MGIPSATMRAPARAVPAAARARRRGVRCCPEASAGRTLDDASLDRVALDLQVLAHPIRLRILEVLARRGGELCACDLEPLLPVKQPTVSHHLRLLREAGLVDAVRKGLWAHYFVRPAALDALRGRVTGLLGILSEANHE